jgi:hypothetical protein
MAIDHAKNFAVNSLDMIYMNLFSVKIVFDKWVLHSLNTIVVTIVTQQMENQLVRGHNVYVLELEKEDIYHVPRHTRAHIIL